MWDVCKVAEHVGIVLNYVGKMLNHVGKTLNYVGKFSNHVGILKIADRVIVISNKNTYKLAFNNQIFSEKVKPRIKCK